MIYVETIEEMITKDLFETNSELNETVLSDVYYNYCNEMDTIQKIVNELISKVKKQYPSFARIEDLSQDWIIDTFGIECYNSSLQYVINYRVDKDNLHATNEQKKELYLIEYENAMLNPNFMDIEYTLKESLRNEYVNGGLK